jgi:hypothetical protein
MVDEEAEATTAAAVAPKVVSRVETGPVGKRSAPVVGAGVWSPLALGNTMLLLAYRVATFLVSVLCSVSSRMRVESVRRNDGNGT